MKSLVYLELVWVLGFPRWLVAFDSGSRVSAWESEIEFLFWGEFRETVWIFVL